MISFLQLSQLLFNNQLLASGDTVQSVLSKYHLAMEHGHEYVGLGKKVTGNTEFNTKVFKGTDGSKIGILPIKGMLVYEETGWETLCGMTAYEGVQAQAEKMIFEHKVDKIILEVNSGGGMAYGCFETAQYIRKIATDNGVTISTYVDGSAFSGGYAFASIGDEVIVNPMAKVGSIGVVLPLTNTSERDKKEGVERIYITAGKSKVPYDKDGKFTSEFLEDIEDDIMVTYDMFVNHVADMRGIDAQVVKDTEAKCFGTKEALKLGLIDSVMTKEQYYEHLGNFNGDTTMSLHTNKAGAKVEGDEGTTQVAGAENSVLVNQLSGQISTLEDKATADAKMIADLTAGKTKVEGELVTANATIDELRGQISTLTAEKAAAVTSARKEKISALVSVDDVEEHMEFVADFDDAKFDKYIGKLTATSEKISASFTEQGVDTQGAAQPELSVEARMKQRMQAKRNGG